MDGATSGSAWRKCSSCKTDIGFATKYYVCSVSTCNGQRTGYVFCSVSCFERHLPGAKHRDAAAIEEMSPSGTRRIVAAAPSATPSSGESIPRDILIVASKLKDYIRARAGMNTSGNVMEILSEIVRRKCDEAVDNARAEGRKTVMDRDFRR